MQKELEIVAQQSGLEITQSEMILQQFTDFFEQAKVWERQAKLAPEKEKMFAFAEKIRLIESPMELSENGQLIVEWAETELLKISQGVKEKIKKL